MKHIPRLLAILLALIAFSLPYSRNISSVLIILGAVAALVHHIYSRSFRLPKPYTIGYLLFLGLYLIRIIGLAYTDNIDAGLFELEKSMPLWVLPYIMGQVGPLSKKQVKVILFAFIVGVGVCILAGLSRSLFLLATEGVAEGKRLAHYFEMKGLLYYSKTRGHVYMGMYLAWSVLICVYFIATEVKKTRWIPIAIFFLAALLLTTAKMALLASVASLAYFSLSYLKKPIYVVLILAGLAGAVVLGYQSKFARYRIKSTERLITGDFKLINKRGHYETMRYAPLKCAVENLKTHWLFGVGTGDTSDALEECYNSIGLTELYKVNTHNQYLDYWLSFGLLGLFIIIAYQAVLFFKAFQKKYVFFQLFLVFTAFLMLTENIFSANKGLVFYSLFLGVLLYSNYGISREEVSKKEA